MREQDEMPGEETALETIKEFGQSEMPVAPEEGPPLFTA